MNPAIVAAALNQWGLLNGMQNQNNDQVRLTTPVHDIYKLMHTHTHTRTHTYYVLLNPFQFFLLVLRVVLITIRVIVLCRG
jgi:hypothetical protein